MVSVNGSEPQNYLEAYPRINLIEAERAIAAGRTVCFFRNQDDFPVGQAALPQITDNSVWLAYDVAGRGLAAGKGEVQLSIELVRGGMFGYRFNFHCPGCEHRVAILILKNGDWRCRSCHRLHYRRQLIDATTVAAEHFARLKAQVGRGRPRGMHRSTFKERTAELCASKQRIRKLAQADRRYWPVHRQLAELAPDVLFAASEAHRLQITAQWIEPKDLPSGCWLDGYTVRDNKLVPFIKDW